MQRRSIYSTREAVETSVGIFSYPSVVVLWSDRGTRAEVLAGSKSTPRKFDPDPLFSIIPALPATWPARVARLNELLGTNVKHARHPYLSRVPFRGEDKGRTFSDVVRWGDSGTPSNWGFTPLAPGQGRLPVGLRWMHEVRGNAWGVVDANYRAVQRMRSHVARDKGLREGDRDFRAWYWDGKGRRDAIFPYTWFKGKNFGPDVWIRRRPVRAASPVVALSFFTVDQKTWTIFDVTPAVAVMCSDPDTAGRSDQWRRGVFLVERGDGAEWVATLPSHAPPVEGVSREDAERLGVVPTREYPGAPLRGLRKALADHLRTPPRLHWIREDKPLRGESPIQ